MKTFYMVCIISMLMSQMAVANNEENENPLDLAGGRLAHAIRVRHFFAIRLLVKKHGTRLLERDIHIGRSQGKKALDYIVTLQNPDLVRLCLAKGASLSSEARQSITLWRNRRNKQEALAAWHYELHRRTMRLICARET